MKLKIVLPLTLLLTFCTANNRSSKDSDSLNSSSSITRSDSIQNNIPVNQKITEFSRFIAGMPNNLGTSKKSALWQKLAPDNDEKWNILQQKIGNPIKNWVKTAGLEQPSDPKTLFYPFAGGDFYYSHLFFPNVDTTIMIGLEPTGSVFDPDQKSDKELSVYYQNLPQSLFVPHKLGFFRTNSMAVDFRKGLLNGTIHTVLFYMARFDANIHYIQHFDLDADGKPIDKNEQSIAYKIGYSFKDDKKIRELIYFSYNVSDQYLVKKPMLMKYLDRRGNMITYFKAASYLMHFDTFNTFRDFILKSTVRLLQDDSGLPYKLLLKDGFDVKLLGKFTRTIPLFAEEFQPELKAAYTKAKYEPLPFLIGYNSSFGECNLQSARKKR